MAGALIDCHAPEAPHIYKKDGFYYLMIAEGGTSFYHAVTIARSREALGEYKGYEGNPILTHRHLGPHMDITCTGHGDLVRLRDGSWYMALLACRPYGGNHANMGRETAGGFIGAYIGGFASGNGENLPACAVLTGFSSD